MIFRDKQIKLGIIILDDRGDNRKEVHWCIEDCLIDYLGLKNQDELQMFVTFMPEELFECYDQYGNLEDSDYIDARDFLYEDKRLNEADLVALDVNWAPETGDDDGIPLAGNVNGITLAEIISKRVDVVKMIYSGAEADIVKHALKKQIPHIVKKGCRFHPKIFRKPGDFNRENWKGVIDDVMVVFKKKRAKYLRENCLSTEILELLKLPELSGELSLKIKNPESRFEDVPLKNIFFECRQSEQYKKELKNCYQAKSRFEIMKYFWSHEDIKLASHIKEEEGRQRGMKLLTEGTFIEESLYKATQFFHEEIRPEFGEEEIKVIEEFFNDVENLIKRFGMDQAQTDSFTQIINNFLDDLHYIGNKLKRRTRFYLDELKKMFDSEHSMNFTVPPLDGEWYCYVGDFHTNPTKFKIDEIGDDGLKGHIATLWNTLDKAGRTLRVYDNREKASVVLLELKGKLASHQKHSNGGAFDLHHSSLQERIGNGSNLRKIIKLLPHYFTPFIVESYGTDSQWHCVNFSVINNGRYETLTCPKYFLNVTGLKALNQLEDEKAGVRYILCIARCK